MRRENWVERGEGEYWVMPGKVEMVTPFTELGHRK